MSIRFEHGDVAVVRYIWFERISHARPVRVVRDEQELIALYLAPGTPVKGCNPPGQLADYNDMLLSREWPLLDLVWRTNHVLMLARPDEWLSVWGFWPDGTEGTAPVCWYVNLEEPMRRSHAGYDTRDLQLDVVIWPDGRCEWKDEEDYASMRDVGLVSDAENARIRADAQATIDAAARGEVWWDEWADWRPDPAWTPPTFPDGWDDLSE